MKYFISILLVLNLIVCNYLFFEFTNRKGALDLQQQSIKHKEELNHMAIQCQKALQIIQYQSMKKCHKI